MKDRSTMTTGEYLFSILWGYAIGFTFYKSLMFRLLPNRDIQESFNVLLAMTIASVVGCGIVFRRWKTEWLSAASITLPFGLYTVLAYATTYKPLIRVAVFTAFGLSLAHALLLLSAPVKRVDKKIRRNVYRKRLYRCAYATVCILAVVLCSLMGSMGVHAYFNASLISSSVKAEAAADDNDTSQILSSNMETILKLQPEVWATQSTKERLDVLQTVCNIEAAYLGLSTPVTVGGDNLVPPTLGVYSDGTRLIQISLNHIEEDSVEEVLKTLLHEVHHCYEYRLAEAYNAASPDIKRLRIFKDASHYANEIKNYIAPKDDYYGYVSQSLEMDSKTYAEFGVQKYYDQIHDWLAAGGQKEHDGG